MQGMPRCQHGAQTSAPSARCPHGAFIFFLVDWPSMCSEIAFVPETTQARTWPRDQVGHRPVEDRDGAVVGSPAVAQLPDPLQQGQSAAATHEICRHPGVRPKRRSLGMQLLVHLKQVEQVTRAHVQARCDSASGPQNIQVDEVWRRPCRRGPLDDLRQGLGEGGLDPLVVLEDQSVPAPCQGPLAFLSLCHTAPSAQVSQRRPNISVVMRTVGPHPWQKLLRPV
mmetsp:Transcript_2103/g.8207  ORF Transcript_2103/g.8207 Transcript_2103/m.8207 type:complete len:225 (+) Transcript_2103:159-833(+)